jgi:hypothetical protein
MWIVSSRGKNSKPRAYEFPYSRELHTRLTAAKKRMEFGHDMAGELEAESNITGKRVDCHAFILSRNNTRHQNQVNNNYCCS